MSDLLPNSAPLPLTSDPLAHTRPPQTPSPRKSPPSLTSAPLRVSSVPPRPQAKLHPHTPIGQLPLALRDVDSATASDWLAGPPLAGERGGAVEAASRRWEAAKRR